MICNFNTCTICQCEENEIPLPWKQESEYDDIDKRIDDKLYKWVEKHNYSSPYWIVENEIDARNGIFVNLEKNPEAFTNYQGQHIWKAIYDENCFTNNDLICKEDAVLYKIISGLHSNINAHLSKNYLDVQNNITYFNTSMLNDRVLTKPDRINNLFFLYSLLLNSFEKVESVLKNFNITTGFDEEDMKTKYLINNLYTEDIGKIREYSGSCFGENKINAFTNLKVDQLKNKFRNISQIIDCVSCQKCKLHGKLQIYGLATMLKILFSGDLSVEKFKRNEIISFVNLFGKVSNAISYITHTVEENMNAYNSFTWAYLETFALVFAIALMIKMNIYFIGHKEKYSFNKYDRKLQMLKKKN
jgi:ERO1-like protein alpha